jgi:hypothetical protein
MYMLATLRVKRIAPPDSEAARAKAMKKSRNARPYGIERLSGIITA